MAQAIDSGTRLHGLVLRICTGWAILGGFVLLGVVALNVASVVGAAVVNKGLPGDFELTEVGVAIAAFSFLPYCQIAGLNVSADIFTARASRFWLALFSFLGALVALVLPISLTLAEMRKPLEIVHAGIPGFFLNQLIQDFDGRSKLPLDGQYFGL